MFGEFIKRLTAPQPARLPDADARLALTALLVRVARSDGYYAEAEKAQIDAAMSQRYGLDGPAMEELRAQAEVLEAEAPDTVRFTRAIKDAVGYEDRLGVIEALWGVVLADGERAKEEDALLRLVSSLLGVEDMDSNLARKRVEASL
ncbi:TerB family tellurite resistance protein [Aliishimia ponticola]|uniref:TerB family tellurite resistance protein n=1 Tax=Aliishimia ponticola TaxID=2499833 RepID=A0A4S4NI21_9RHOB|nr:TerB family tellurite resistance protein [Aliishimia ponticola]THH35750.1 TerB family tellurite resistance protein [Aliishimia ponticola]